MKIIKRLAIGLLAGLLLLAMAGCSKKGTDSRTLDHFTKAFEDAGHSVADATEPLFAAVGATAGTMFKIGDETVKIYMYESEEALEKAQKDYASTVKDFKRNGRFLLETTNQKAQDIFNKVEKAK